MHKKMIESHDISVVVQGIINTYKTQKCLKSIRKHLPKAEIILSTWENSDVGNLNPDILILNKDPGAKVYDFSSNGINNSNRQLVSTQNGLKKVRRKYCLKLRSDIALKRIGFLEFWDQFPIVNSKFKMFEHRVLVSSIYSREFANKTRYPQIFHPSDFWFFGLTEDLKRYFLNTPLLDDNESSNYQFKHPNRLPYLSPLWRYAPEQYFCFSYVKQIFPDIKFDDWSDWNEENINQSLEILYNNFIFLSLRQSGIYCKKHKRAMRKEYRIPGLITFHKFLERYQEYCDPTFSIPLKYKASIILNAPKVSKNYNKLKKYWKWMQSPVLVVLYTIKVVVKIAETSYKAFRGKKHEEGI